MEPRLTPSSTDAGPAIGDLPRRAARRFGGRTAVAADDGRLSFSELDALSDRFAAALRARGLGAGDTVTLYGPNGWKWMVAYYGVAKLGAVINPLNPLLTPQEVRFIVDDCGSKLVIGSSERLQGLAETFADHAVGFLAWTPSPHVAPDTDFERSLAVEGDPFAAPAVDAGATAVICYTSGTTGLAKGARLSNRNIVSNVALTATLHGRTSTDVVVSALPCAHVYGAVVMNGAVLCGSTLRLFAKFDAGKVLQAIGALGATVFDGVPTMYLYLLQHPDIARADLSSLRICTVGGQTMAVSAMAEVEARFGCRLIELWGMTELGGLGATHPHLGEARLGSIGCPLPFMEARIVDGDDLARTLGTGKVGELLVRGPVVMQGYLGRPEDTAACLTPDGWLRSGDLARRDADGFLHIVDRKKDIIISAGNNIYPAEVERAISAHPAVAMVTVTRRPDPLKGEVPVAFVIARPGEAPSESEIIAHCRGRLAAYKLPRAVTFVSDLPKTSSGKLVRRNLTAETPR